MPDQDPSQLPPIHPSSTAASAGSAASTSPDAGPSPTIDRVARGAHETIDRLADQLSPAVDSVRHTATALSQRQAQWTDGCRAHVRESPLASVAMAAMAGLLLGSLLTR